MYINIFDAFSEFYALCYTEKKTVSIAACYQTDIFLLLLTLLVFSLFIN